MSSEQEINIIEYLNNSIWVKLNNTENNVGVVAIRDIPINTKITDYDNPETDLKFFLIQYEIYLKNIDKLNKSVRGLINDRYVILKNGKFYFYSPNCHQMYRFYINHSSNPNVNQELKTLRSIKKNEEITISYKDFYLNNNLSEESKKYHSYIKYT